MMKYLFYFHYFRNEDFTMTMYKTFYQNKSNTPLEAKVNTVCIKLKEVFNFFIVYKNLSMIYRLTLNLLGDG